MPPSFSFRSKISFDPRINPRCFNFCSLHFSSRGWRGMLAPGRTAKKVSWPYTSRTLNCALSTRTHAHSIRKTLSFPCSSPLSSTYLKTLQGIQHTHLARLSENTAVAILDHARYGWADWTRCSQRKLDDSFLVTSFNFFFFLVDASKADTTYPRPQLQTLPLQSLFGKTSKATGSDGGCTASPFW